MHGLDLKMNNFAIAQSCDNIKCYNFCVVPSTGMALRKNFLKKFITLQETARTLGRFSD